jgi:uncharacterized protein
VLDVNNVYVNAANHGFDADAYLQALPAAAIAEVHLAGHEAIQGLLVDTHGTAVSEPVWALYERAVGRFGAVPTLVERDTNLPPLEALLAEAERARSILESRRVEALPA